MNTIRRAAGIATAVAAASVARADIIHSDIDDIVIVGLSWAPEETANIDLDADGAMDLTFIAGFDSVGGSGGPYGYIFGAPPHGNANILVDPSGWSEPSPFAQGEFIGPPGPGRQYTTASQFKHVWPTLLQGQSAYIGVRFPIGDADHYGWVRVSASIDHDRDMAMVISIYEFAHQTLPRTPIRAGMVPAPGSLAAFAVGAAAFTRRSRKEHGIVRH